MRKSTKRLGIPTARHARALLALLLVASGAATHAADAALLNTLFQDYGVVQRDQPIPVWGQARPDEVLTIRFAGNTVTGRADARGAWQATLPALHAGGPYTLEVSSASGARQQARDLLVGDVWLCSGQSNMELQVHRTLNSRAEIAGADNDRIRLLKVPQVGMPAPQSSFATAVEWKPANPQNVPDFSAACYYFARELQKTVDVPMGLINASLGGSRIEAWLGAAALRSTGGQDEALDALARYSTDPVAANASWATSWAKWWRALPGMAQDEPWNPATSSSGWRDAPRPLTGYQQWGVRELANFTGMLWYRTTIRLTAQQAAQDATLSLGNVDEIDESWVNGIGVGSSYGGGARDYRLRKGLLHAGDNLVTVNVLNTYMEGGIYGPPAARALRFADGSSVPLDANGWQYRMVADGSLVPPLAPWLSASGRTTLYNGMIAPLGHYALRGALWYQGESNTAGGDAGHYRKLLEAWRDDTRARFGAQLPLLLIQLSSYGAAPTHPAESGWAEVREAERLVAANDAHMGLAVSVDIGERYDIHPANKQELARRLARAARHVVYGEPLPPSGPQPVSARRAGDAIAVSFGDVTGKLVAYSSAHPVGFELCGMQAGSCRYADADISGSQVSLHPPGAPGTITRVRYCWSESPTCTLYDESGLPAGPFQLEIAAP
ncbi:MAG: sialate O-acetylesterase [Pseudomonadota bacterium]